MLNQSGKRVLIEVAITAIPTYAMSVFYLPKTWCSEINSMIENSSGIEQKQGGTYIGSGKNSKMARA